MTIGEGNSGVYQVPTAALVDEAITRGPLPAAQRWRRFVNYLVDYLAQIGAIMLLVFVLSMVGAQEMVDAILALPDLVIGLGAVLLYYGLLEGLFGRSLGKWITGTQVVTTEGKPASFGAIIGRTLCRFIPFEVFSIFSRGRICWHDQIPSTKVVESEVLRRWLAGENIVDESPDDALPQSDTTVASSSGQP